jgi:hypothetical protein
MTTMQLPSLAVSEIRELIVATGDKEDCELIQKLKLFHIVIVIEKTEHALEW